MGVALAAPIPYAYRKAMGAERVIARNVISHEEGAELKRLYADFAAASERARIILATEGMESPRFFEADKATGAIWRRIREIIGTPTHIGWPRCRADPEARSVPPT
jgi:hypothetical protein